MGKWGCLLMGQALWGTSWGDHVVLVPQSRDYVRKY